MPYRFSRNFRMTILCCALVSISAFAQNSATFHVRTLPAQTNINDLYVADLNGDGIPDLIETYDRLVPNGFSVQLGQGDGTFAAPVNYTFPVQNQAPLVVTTADVNGDGKADVIIGMGTISAPSTLLVYLGRGDGTLQAPTSTVLSSFINFLAAADFNQDGKVDLAVVLTNSSQTSQTIAVMYGNGSGAFTAPSTVMPIAFNHGVGSLALGDFDADGHADIAVAVGNPPCFPGTCASTSVYILYGSGTGSFTNKRVFAGVPGDFTFSSGDVNLDGRTDLAGLSQTSTSRLPKLLILYGQKSRTVASAYLTTPNLATGSAVITDFNGDGHNDLATFGSTASGKLVLDLFRRTATGTFSTEQVPIRTNAFIDRGQFVVGDFNRDRKPDLLFAGTINNGTNSTLLYELVNTTTNGHFSTCAFPSAVAAIHVCTPVSGSTVTSPVHFTVTADWFEPIRKIELWVDGVKLTEQYQGWDKYHWFDYKHSFASGTHHASIFSAGYDNALQHKAVTFTVP